MSTNVELRVAREALSSPTVPGEPMSRAELAEAVNAELWRSTKREYSLDAHAIARYERGSVRWPSSAYRSALRGVLGVATDAELGFAPTPRGRAATARTPRLSAGRDLVHKQPAAPDADHPSTSVVESLELLASTASTDVGSGTIDELEQLVDRLDETYFAESPEEFRTIVLGYRQHVSTLLAGRCTLRERARLYAVAGWLTGLVAESSLALGQDASTHCVTALSLAREIGNSRLAGWALGTRAQVALYAGDPSEAVAFAQAGRDVAPVGSAASFRASALEGRALARTGDKAATERAIFEAEQALDRRTGTRTGTLFSFDPPYLPYYTGTAYRWLGDNTRARTWAGRAIALCDADPNAWPVARTSARIDSAVASIRLGELDTAMATGWDAIEIWSKRPTNPARIRIEELLTVVEPFRERPVAELVERWWSVSRSAVGLPTEG